MALQLHPVEPIRLEIAERRPKWIALWSLRDDVRRPRPAQDQRKTKLFPVISQRVLDNDGVDRSGGDGGDGRFCGADERDDDDCAMFGKWITASSTLSNRNFCPHELQSSS